MFHYPSIRRVALFASLLVLLLAGCVKGGMQGESYIITYEPWVGIVLAVGGIGAFIAGLALRSHGGSWVWIMMIGGPIAAIVMAPGYFMNKVEINLEGFEIHTGIWNTTHQSVKFADVNSIRITDEISSGRRGRKNTNVFLICQMKDGQAIKVGANNELTHDAAEEIWPLAEKLGIPVSNEQDGK